MVLESRMHAKWQKDRTDILSTKRIDVCIELQA